MVRVNTCGCFPHCDAESKACFECGRELPKSEFYQHAMMGDGHLNKCKDCVREYQRARHHERMQDAEWREAERERSREKMRRLGRSWAKPDPIKKAASHAVSNAVRDGRLIPADSCDDCGHDFSEFRREGHHEDYDKPLEVVWLCSLCHGKRHRSAA